MDFPPRKPRRKVLPNAMILPVVALSLATFARADDEITGKARVSDAFGFTLLFVLAGYSIGWLPEIWARTHRTRFEWSVTPIFVGLILGYLFLGFRCYFIQPGATGLAVSAQLFVLIGLSCRVE